MSAAPSPRSVNSSVSRGAWWQRTWGRRCLFVAGGCFVLAIVWWGFRDDSISPVAPIPVAPLIIEKSSQTVRKDGKRLWHFGADKIELSPDGSQTFAHNLSNGILFSDDKPLLHITAKEVHLENTTNNVDASEGVKVTGDNRLAISSRLVRWNYERKILSCPAPVKAQVREFTFDAPYLQYKWDLGELTCNAPVELHAPGVTLGAKSLRISTKSQTLELGGDTRLAFDPHKAHPKEWKDLLAKP